VPGWGATTLLPSTRLLLKRQEMVEVEKVLQRRREEFRQRMEHLALRRQRLGQRQEQLRDAILKFDTFLKVLRRGSGPGWPLGLLSPPAAQFQDVPAMLAHFVALARTQAALAQQAEARQELQRYQEEASSELLHTSKELDQLHACLEATRHDVLQEESHWAHIQNVASQKTLLLGQIKLAVLNLFQLTTARLEVPVDVDLEDTEAQLDMVLLCMQDLAAICAELLPREPGPCPPRLPAATSTRRRGARVPPGQE
ncbi:CC42M protein, partial [Oreotrochilus melanogaster]|nr:CC42M protein [Oreotrochilus melanogaster]